MLPPKLAHEVIKRRLRLIVAQPTENLLGIVRKPQARVRFQHLAELRLAHGASERWGHRTHEIDDDPRRGGGDYGLGVQGDARVGVQGDGVPNGLEEGAVGPFAGVDVGGGEEFAGGVGAIDFETLVRGGEVGGFGPAEVVEQAGDGEGLLVDGGPGRVLGGGEEGEDGAAEGVVYGGGEVVLLDCGVRAVSKVELNENGFQALGASGESTTEE